MDVQVLRPLLFPKGTRNFSHVRERKQEEEIFVQDFQELYSVLEKLSVQISILDLQQHKESEEASIIIL